MGLGYKQDGPPPGGFGNIYWKRTHAATSFTWQRAFGALGLSWALGYWTVRSVQKRLHRLGLEESDVRQASAPFVAAERDRRVLRMWRHNRDLETELMKDVPGWKVGTFWGEPLFYFSPNQEIWWDRDIQEAATHQPEWRSKAVTNMWNVNEQTSKHFYEAYLPEWWLDMAPGGEHEYNGNGFSAAKL